MANGQTIIQYGDTGSGDGSQIMLYRCQTGTVQQRPVYDASRTVMYWKFTVTGIGYINGFTYGCAYAQALNSSSSSSSSGAAAFSSASQGDQQIRWRLKSRQKFVMAVGCSSNTVTSGRTLLSANPMTAVTSPRAGLPTGLTGYDVDDGPRCLQFDIIHISGDNVYKIAYAFEINIILCGDDSNAQGNTNGVLSNRWSVNDTWDHNKRTIRTYTGLVELATSQFNPHWFRNLVVPPLQPGMRRDYGSFTGTEDGKHLQYTVTDTEVAIACPAPATRWDIQHSETALSQDGLKMTSQCTVTLEGESDCDIGQLIVLGLYVVSIKLAGVKPGDAVAGVLFMNDLTITEFVGDVNRVVVSGSGWRPAIDLAGFTQRAEGFNKAITAADLPTFSAATFDPLLSRDARVGENTRYQGVTALAGIFKCYLQSSCASVAGIADEPDQENLNAATDNYPKFPTTVRVVPTIDTSPVSYYSSSQQTATYSKFQMESIYNQKSTRVAAPIARSAYTGSGFDTRDSMAVGRLANTVCFLDVRISADRLGQQPQMPDPENLFNGAAVPYGSILGSIPMKFLDGKLLGRTETMSANGVPLYHADWNGRYVLLRSYSPDETLRLGNNQWQTGSGTNSTTNLTKGPYP